MYQTTSTSVSVNVLDQPDLDPQFLNEPYVGSVPENCPLVCGARALLRPLPGPCVEGEGAWSHALYKPRP